MYVIEDANFLISVLKRTERFHSDAIDTLPILSNSERVALKDFLQASC